MDNTRFKKESQLAKSAMSLDDLVVVRARCRERLAIMESSNIFNESDIKEIEASIADLSTRITYRQARLERRAKLGVRKSSISEVNLTKVTALVG